jgi:hypothetical protein
MRGSPAERLVAQFRQTYPTLTTEEIMVKMAVVLLMEATPPAQAVRRIMRLLGGSADNGGGMSNHIDSTTEWYIDRLTADHPDWTAADVAAIATGFVKSWQPPARPTLDEIAEENQKMEARQNAHERYMAELLARTKKA